MGVPRVSLTIVAPMNGHGERVFLHGVREEWMAKVKLCPKTLRWLARQAAKQKVDMPMHEHQRHANAAFEQVRFICMEEARRIERQPKAKANR